MTPAGRAASKPTNLELVGEEGSEGSRWLPTEVPLHKTHMLIHHGVGAGLFDFILLAVKETVLNIWKPDLSEKLRPAAQAAWRGQQLYWALEEDGLLGSPDNGQGGKGRKRVEKQGWRSRDGGCGGWGWGAGGRGGRNLETTQDVPPTGSISTSWELKLLEMQSLRPHPGPPEPKSAS